MLMKTKTDSEAAAKPVDPLASLEKTAAAKTLQTTVVAPRIEELYDHSDRVNSDPYTHSKRIRKFFREEKKIEKAKEILTESDTSITDIAFSLGFSSSNYFCAVFKKFMDCTPKDYRKKYR